MTYRFIYSQSEKNRIVPAVLIDKRAAVTGMANQIGSVIKSITDSQVAIIDETCIFYKIETEGGNLAGYFTLKVIREGTVSLLQYELRPPFEQFSSVISGIINNFMVAGKWVYDYLN